MFATETHRFVPRLVLGFFELFVCLGFKGRGYWVLGRCVVELKLGQLYVYGN